MASNQAQSPIAAPGHAGPAESRAARLIRDIFESGRPLTYIRSSEEQRVRRVLREVSLRLAPGPTPVWEWSLTEGMSRDGAAEPGTLSPRAVLDFIAAHAGGAIFHLKDFHEPLRDSMEIRRRLRDVYEACLDRGKYVVITSPVRFLPEEIERSVIFVELRPPDVEELSAFLREETTHISPPAPVIHSIASALQGLTLDEARYALRRALAASPQLGPEALPAVLEEKRLLVNRTGFIEFVADPTGLGEIGGLQGLKKWLLERRKLFQMRDELDSEIVPKGVLLMGIPGCGKSLSVKAIASSFELPLYRIDMIEIFSGRHGKPDEIEMGITSTESGGEQGRIFAFFLTWMQEKTRGLFVAATANRIDLLPAEMIRKGRFDEVFFVDLPLDDERIEIFKIHLSRRGVDPAAFDLKQLVAFTTGWAGAEVEQCVVSAITEARLQGRRISEQDLIDTAVRIVPLSRTMKEQIHHIRGWAFERAVRASPNQMDR
jgi:hypothetical protein